MIHYFKYNGVSSENFGLYITNYDIYNPPAKRTVFESIPGRDGDVIIEDSQGRYSNMKITYTVAFSTIFSDGCVERHIIKKIKEWLYGSTGYCTLEDSYNPAYYRYATIFERINIEKLIDGSVDEIKITFDCEPYMYSKKYHIYKSTAREFEIYNPYNYLSLPKITIKINTEGNPLTLKINNDIFRISAPYNSVITIDSKSKEITEKLSDDSFSESTKIINEQGKFPCILPGRNLIIWTGFKTQESIEIETRWRCL